MSESSRDFDFKSLGLAGVLQHYRLHVPPYQREYSWKTEHVEQLYEDLRGAKLDDRDYFLGTIVTIRRGGLAPLELVDGQQRITTVAILIAAIRNYLIQRGGAEYIVEAIQTELLTIIDRAAGERVPKLRLNIDDNEFFRQLMAEGVNLASLKPSRDSHDKLLDAMVQANATVQTLANSFPELERAERFNSWLEFLELKANVVLLETTNGAQAFKMFETLNDRGLKTSQADLVKSYLFAQSGERIQEAQSKWSSMKDTLEELNDEEATMNFLWHVMIATRQFTKADGVYETAQESIRGQSNAVAFLSDLERLARVYVSTYRTDAEHWADYPTGARRGLRTINKFDIKPMRPLVLALATNFRPQEATRAFTFLMALSVRLIISSSTRSGSIQEAFAAAALGVTRKEITNLDTLKTALGRVVVSDAEFRESFVLARSSKPDLARYYLRSLEAAHANESEPWYTENDDEASITLEHVMPKSSVKGALWNGFTEEEARRYLKRFGNLCLMTRTLNSDIDNTSFETKKLTYSLAPYEITRQVSDYEKWSPESIENRQAILAELALKAWPI